MRIGCALGPSSEHGCVGVCQDALGVDHVIVAHSHGGNVVGYALQDEHLRAAVRGVVCLGTPFLIAERIALHRDLYRVMRLTLAGVALIALSAWQRSTDSVAWYVAGGGLVLALPVVGLLTWAALRTGSGRLSWRALAAGALGTAQFSAWLLREAQRRLDHVMKRLDTRRMAVAPAIGLAVLQGGAAAYAGLISHQSANAVRGLAIMFLLVSGLTAIGIGLLAYVMLVLSLVMHAPFGLDAMLASLRVRTSVEPAPPGCATVLQVPPLKSPTSTLQHSSLYDDDGVIRDVAEWLRGQLRSPVVM